MMPPTRVPNSLICTKVSNTSSEVWPFKTRPPHSSDLAMKIRVESFTMASHTSHSRAALIAFATRETLRVMFCTVSFSWEKPNTANTASLSTLDSTWTFAILGAFRKMQLTVSENLISSFSFSLYRFSAFWQYWTFMPLAAMMLSHVKQSVFVNAHVISYFGFGWNLWLLWLTILLAGHLNNSVYRLNHLVHFHLQFVNFVQNFVHLFIILIFVLIIFILFVVI
ncbi:Hypothetical_protein [Hexamita inflata]|uniref:Hypothetical_protein n=1 Tax=Hexamita inflata TaxID=28002 RepID=A0AA86QE92_9EUKA|nr:Hypothetical protein HINF_LOCUS44098 [Hexamita inflata]